MYLFHAAMASTKSRNDGSSRVSYDPQRLPPGLLSTFLERDPELTKPSFPPTTYKGSMPRHKQLRCPILDPKSQDFSSNLLQQHDHR